MEPGKKVNEVKEVNKEVNKEIGKFESSFIDTVCNEMAQPLTVIFSLVDLWEQGLSEPEDLALLKYQIQRLGDTLRDLRGLRDLKEEPASPVFLAFQPTISQPVL